MFQIPSMPSTLKSLSLENFRCFKKNQSIDFEKLTILTGENSSGKSSIIAAILGALQSGAFPFKFSPNGKYTNMGDFNEVSNKHDPSNLLNIGVKISREGGPLFDLNTTWECNKSNSLPELNSIQVKAKHFDLSIKKGNGYLLNFSYYSQNDPEYKDKDVFINYMLASFDSSFTQFQRKSKRPNKDKDKKERVHFQKYIESNFEDITIKNLKIPNLEQLDSHINKKGNMRLIRTVNSVIKIFNDYEENINLISSFRLHPDRTYLEKSKEDLKVDKFGDGYLDQIVLWEHQNPAKFSELIAVMEKLTLFHSLKTHRIGGGRFEYLVSTKKGSIPTSISDVGFGINQFLPIIVADLQLPKSSTLFVAEPEIHLHPPIQANFGDYLVDQIAKNNKNYVIETHSEYLLNRIRLAIVKGTLKESDLAIYYLENKENDVIIHKLKFGKRGQIEGAPNSFFDTYLIDLKDIALSVE